MNLTRATNNLRLFGVLSVLTGLFIGIGYLVGGTAGMVLGLALAGAGNFISYWFSDKIVLKTYDAEEATKEEYPELNEMVEELSDKAGLPKPEVYVANLGSPNAFATGRNPSNSAVCVSKSIMNTLNQEELEGVIAHELAHIKNRDTLINSVVATLAGGIAVIAELIFWSSMFAGREREGRLFSSLVLMILAPLIATLLKSSISRKMEYRADTDAVNMTGSEKLGDALTKINKAAKPASGSNVAQAGSNIFISNPFKGQNMTKYFSTHPPLEARLENIEKSLDN